MHQILNGFLSVYRQGDGCTHDKEGEANIPLQPPPHSLISLVPGRCGCNLKLAIFKLTPRVDILSTSCAIALGWMPQDFTDDKSTLDKIMAWWSQATSHYLSQCWPRFISPYGVARPQWIKTFLNVEYVQNCTLQQKDTIDKEILLLNISKSVYGWNVRLTSF